MTFISRSDRPRIYVCFIWTQVREKPGAPIFLVTCGKQSLEGLSHSIPCYALLACAWRACHLTERVQPG